MQDPKNCDLGTIPQLCWSISLRLRHVSTIGEKNSSNISSRCPHNIVNFGLLSAEVCWRVWGTPANFNGFRILAALLHGTLVVGVSQTLRRWTEGATYIWQGSHYVGHWPTFLVSYLNVVFRSFIRNYPSTLYCYLVVLVKLSKMGSQLLSSVCWRTQAMREHV